MGQRRMALLPLCPRHRPASSVRTDHHHRCVLLVAARGSGQICLDADTFDIHEGQAQFRMLTGGSLGHHLRELRIKKACSLLHGTALSITQIAEQCGFDSSGKTGTFIPCHRIRRARRNAASKPSMPSTLGRKFTSVSSTSAATVGANMVPPNRTMIAVKRTKRRSGRSTQISVSRVVAGTPLKDRRRHPCYLKPYAFLAEDVNKPCERRNRSCRSHRSSGFALRLIANKILSSGDRSGNFPSLRCSASNLFCSWMESCHPHATKATPHRIRGQSRMALS